jgi:hypothetical protein
MFIYLDVQDFDLWTSPISMPLFHPFVTDFNESGWDHTAGKLAFPQSLHTVQDILKSVFQ